MSFYQFCFQFLSDPSPIIGNACQWLTDSLPFSKLDWCDSGMWRWQLKTCWSCYCCWSWWWETCRQQFGCRFGRLTLAIKLSFCSDFEDKVSRFVQDFEVDVQARFWSWSLVIILLLMLGCGYEVHSWSRFWFGLVKIFKFKFCRNGDVWLRFWSWCKVEILKMFDQDLYKNLWYYLKKLLW